MIPVTKPFLPPLSEYQKYIADIWERNWVTNNFNKHAEILSNKDILVIESVAKKEMLELGYKLETAANWKWIPRITGVIMRFKRKLSKWKNRELFNKEMEDLHSKLGLIGSFKQRFEAKNKNNNG